MENLANDFNCSYGTYGIINALTSDINKKFRWNTIIVNIVTIMRNCYMKDISYKDLLLKMQTDIETINLYTDSYVNGKYPATVYYYFPEYLYCLVLSLYRKMTKQNEAVYELYAKLYNSFVPYVEGDSSKHLPIFDLMSSITENKEIKSFYTIPPKIPAISLFKECQTKRNIRPCLISHYEIDYHLKAFFYNLSIILSFSGRVLANNRDITNKLYKSNIIRFNKYSHYLFGDSTLVKSHISRADKKRLKEFSLRENWALLTDHALYKRLKQYNLINERFNFDIY